MKKAIKRTISAIILTYFVSVNIHGQSAALKALENEAISRSVVAALAVSDKGDTLVSHNSRMMLVPASNMKLITTGAALHRLGADYHFHSSLGYSGTIENGVLKGDLYIMGGADPTLASADTIATPWGKTFSAWKKLMDKAGIRKIDGHIIGDGRFIDGMKDEQTWQWYDLGTYYGCGVSGLSFFENGLNIKVAPGEKISDPVEAKVVYPNVPWLDIKWDCLTAEKGTGDQLYFYITDLHPSAALRGTYALGKGPKILACSNKFPEYTCAWYFCRYLKNQGISCTDGPADIDGAFPIELSALKAQQDLTAIGGSDSPSLETIARVTNRASNNFYAETMFRTLGKHITGSACYDSSRVAIYKVLEEMKVDRLDGARITDGSGLSKHNYLSPDFICSFLKAMEKSPSYESFLKGLPQPGGPGTLRNRMKSCSENERKRFHFKSGSMDGVRCFSGYVLPDPKKGGSTIYFSLMINNCTAKNADIYAVVDEFLAGLL